MHTLGGVTSAPMSASHFFRNKPLSALSPPVPFSPPVSLKAVLTPPTPQLPNQSSLCVCAAPHCSAYPVASNPADGPYSLVLFTSPTCPAEHTTNPFIACLSAPFSELKEERGGYTKTKTKETIKLPLLPMNPALAVSQLQTLWTNLEACKVAHYSSRGGVFQERLASMADEHREGFVRGFGSPHYALVN